VEVRCYKNGSPIETWPLLQQHLYLLVGYCLAQNDNLIINGALGSTVSPESDMILDKAAPIQPLRYFL
jgi:hypothetical protein